MADRLLGGIIAKRYRLVEQIGRGSFGRVYAAEELRDGEVIGRVAVKLLTPDAMQQRLLVREIDALARLRDPHILSYEASGQVRAGIDDVVYIVTELAEGTLADLVVPPSTLPVAQAPGLVAGMAQALTYLHGQGLVHRDLKPANVFRVGEVWKLGDFGLVRQVGGSATTATGIMGTFAYMAPEMFHSQVGPASDVYALGVTLLEALTGHPAHEAPSQPELIQRVLREPPNIPATLPEPYRWLIERCLAKEPAARPKAAELLTTLEAPPELPVSHRPTVLAPETVLPAEPSAALGREAVASRRRRPWWQVCVAALLVAGLCLLGLAATRSGATRSGATRHRPMALPDGLPDYLARWRQAMPSDMKYRIREADGMPQVQIPAGEFTMGAAKEDMASDKQSQRTVYVSEFWIDLHFVTKSQYYAYCQRTRCYMPMDFRGSSRLESNHCPVTGILWSEAVAYARSVGGSLPTESQWEKAARGGLKGQLYPWGSEERRDTVRFPWDEEVGSDAPNRYGVFDLGSGLEEWCADWFYVGWLERRRMGNSGPRARRGGYLRSTRGIGAECASRAGADPNYRGHMICFRCVSR